MFHCANPVTPEGGAKDISPPVVLACEPPNSSTHFSSPNIQITFNEFIALKSASSEILISPPLSKKPDYKQRGKSIIVDINDSLAANTTYIINFGKSVTDITEGNILSNYRYVFSTGDHIDSLSISGQVTNAFDNKPVPEVFAQLYLNNNDTIPFDSLPYLVPPLYITETNDQGIFTVENLRDGSYKLFILDDKSGDFLYNMPAEQIAFSDSLVIPYFVPPLLHDSTGQDSVAQPPTSGSDLLFLKLFEEVDSTQEIIKSELVMNDLFRVIYKYPPRSPEIIALNIDSSLTWCMEEFSKKMDTVLLFVTADIPDTLILEVKDGETILDTISITPTKLAEDKKSKKNDDEESKPARILLTWDPKGTFNYLKSQLTGQLSYPVSEYDLSGFLLISDGDTVVPSVEFLEPLMRRFKVTTSWIEGTTNRLIVPESSFISYNGLSNDTVIHTFKTITLRDLGSLAINVNMDDNPGDYIIQILSEKGIVVEETFLNESGQIKFAFIIPAKYTIKAILDSNRNRRWDTGDYLRKIQPETVSFFKKVIEVRGNWDVEEEWKL